ncbi:MAG: trigger factor [Erysipelotrichaceae bacterium]|nr:trigger factor [Erysipelotrichaceae bacterium]
MSEYKKIENAKAEITCEIDKDVWAKAQEKAFHKIAQRVEIKGFRKGQAPKNLVKQAVSENSILLDAVEAIAQQTLEDCIKEHEVELIDRPELKIDKLSPEACTLVFECPVKPDVVLGQYKELGYEVPEQTVSDEEIQLEIDTQLNRKADLELKEDGEVEMGDTAVIDFEGFKDGVAFPGGKGENYDLGIGSHSFIPGFEEQLVGMKSEESKDITLTFPEDYQAEDLAGQEAVFKVTVHEIKKKVLPELNDEFVKSLALENVNTVDELKEHFRKQIMDRKVNDATSTATNQLMDKLAENTVIDIPEVMINEEVENSIRNYESQFNQQGVTLNDFLKITNQTMESFREAQKESAEKRVKMDLILEAIAKAENLAPTDEDVEKEYQRWADAYGMKVEDIKSVLNADMLKKDLLKSLALDFVKTH